MIDIHEDFSWLTPLSLGRSAPADPLAPKGVASGQLIQRTQAWFAARKGKITASIAAACLGLDPHKSRREAWRLIKGLSQDAVPNPHIRRGIEREPHAITVYETRHGVQVAQAGFYLHPIFPWLGASPDALVGVTGLVEVKAPKKLPESIPVPHEIQCRVQLAVTGRLYCDYLAYAGPGRIFEYRVLRDWFQECEMLLKLGEFWIAHVLGNLEPPKKKRLRLPKGEDHD